MFSTSEIVTVAICSPHPITRAGLREILRREDPFHVLDAPLPFERTTAWIREAKPNVVVYDVRSAAETMALLQALKTCSTSTKVILLLEDFAEDFVTRVFQRGVFGCLLKTASPEELVKALHVAHAREPRPSRRLFAKIMNHRPSNGLAFSSLDGQLTPRQNQIVELVSCGMSNKEIATTLVITEATVRAHVNDIFRKLGLHHRIELAIHFARNYQPLMDPRSGDSSNKSWTLNSFRN